VQRKQGWEKTLRQIQGDHLIEKKKEREKILRQIWGDNPTQKTIMGENPKANLRRKPSRENKAVRQPYQKQGRETTLLKTRRQRENPKANQGRQPCRENKDVRKP
jgi:hypothetical protein